MEPLRFVYSIALVAIGSIVLLSPEEQFVTPMHTIRVLSWVLIACGTGAFVRLVMDIHKAYRSDKKDGAR